MAKTFGRLMEERFGAAPGARGDMPVEGPLAAILARRTHRRYKPEPVSGELLEVLLACAQSASSKSDLQQMSVMVVKEAHARATIAGLLPAMPWIAEAPLFLVFLGDVRRNRRICEGHGRPHDNDNLDTFFNATVDAALAMQTFTLAAEAAGLGCCPISYLRNHMATIIEVLALPPGVFPIAGLCVGWPAGKGFVSMRLPPALVVHTDRYCDDALEEELEAYDRRRHAVAPLAPDKQKNAQRYGTAEYCPWSDNVSRQLSIPERADFGTVLRKHGFALK
jgi:nitroreductase/FMN reductase [NAD(P)H]